MDSTTAIAGVGGAATGVGVMWLAGRQLGEGDVGGGMSLSTIGMVGGTIVGAGGVALWLTGRQSPLTAAAVGFGLGSFIGPFAALSGAAP